MLASCIPHNALCAVRVQSLWVVYPAALNYARVVKLLLSCSVHPSAVMCMLNCALTTTGALVISQELVFDECEHEGGEKPLKLAYLQGLAGLTKLGVQHMCLRPLSKEQGPLRLPALCSLNLYNTSEHRNYNGFPEILDFFDMPPAGLGELVANIHDLCGYDTTDYDEHYDVDDGSDDDGDGSSDDDDGGCGSSDDYGSGDGDVPDEPREPRNRDRDFPVLRKPHLAALTKLTLRGSPDDWRVSFPLFAAALALHLPLLRQLVLDCLHFLYDSDIASLVVLPAFAAAGGCGQRVIFSTLDAAWDVEAFSIEPHYCMFSGIFAFRCNLVASLVRSLLQPDDDASASYLR